MARDKPIIFSGPMVRALLDGRKTQTRRVLRPQPDYRGGCGDWHDAEEWGWENEDGYHVSVLDIIPNGYCVGDRLWVRETWTNEGQSEGECLYRATVEDDTGYYLEEIAEIRWRPSIYMPRWASRLTLTVTDVRVQRVREISLSDCYAEGCATGKAEFDANALPRGWNGPWSEFDALWDSLNAKRGYGWERNPWVVALTFTVEQRNIDVAPSQEGGL